MASRAVALVSWPSAPLTKSLVHRYLETLKDPPLIVEELDGSSSNYRLLQWASYDELDHERTALQRDHVLSSSYTFRKALIRKHFLSRCISSYTKKHNDSILKRSSPLTWEMEISFVDELDEMLGDDLWELGRELEDPSKWWILKPGMADRGMGIRIFNSRKALQDILEEFEDEDDGEDDEEGNGNDRDMDGTRVVTSQLRHFVIQEYLLSPLLLDPAQAPLRTPGSPIKRPKPLEGHKFHLRAYCVASGALTIYLYTRVLALFSSVPYVVPHVQPDEAATVDLTPHLTNTSLQLHRGEEGVRLLDELAGCKILSHPTSFQSQEFSVNDIENITEQMSDILADTFRAAVEFPVHFQPTPNAFELYGVDFLLTHPGPAATPSSFQVNLLEINAEPAIELTGPRLTWILEDLFDAVGKVCVEPFLWFDSRPSQSVTPSPWVVGETRHNLRKCLEMRVHTFDEGSRFFVQETP